MKPKIAFIFSQFPCYDEVFVLREMVELDRRLELTIFSLKKSDRDPVRHGMSLPLLSKTVYSNFLLSKELLTGNLRYLLRKPFAYFKTLFSVMLMNWPDPESFIKSLIIFPQSVFFTSVCEKNKIEHVHGQWATYPAVAAWVISRLSGMSFSFTGHAHDIYVNTTGLAAKLRQARFVITCTEYNRRYLLKLVPQLEPAKVHVIRHGVDLNRYRMRKRSGNGKRGSGRNCLHVVSVGSLFECKGFEDLIQSCSLLLKKGCEFRCRIVGGGRLEAKLKRMVSRLGLERHIEFTGYQAQEEMPKHYEWADLFILPAVLKAHWGIPNVLLESLAVGVPVVCTPLPSLPELLGDPPCGFVIPEEDPRAIADLIEKVSGDMRLLREYGLRGRRKIEENWDIKKTAGEIASLFSQDKLLDSHARLQRPACPSATPCLQWRAGSGGQEDAQKHKNREKIGLTLFYPRTRRPPDSYRGDEW